MTVADPFATAPTNDEYVAPKVEETAPVTVAPNVVANSEDFVATLKYGAGYDAPWLVVRDGTAEGLKVKLEEAATTGLMETVAKAAAMAASLAPSAPAKAAPVAPPTFQNGKVVQGGSAGGAGGYTCAHGPRNYKNGGSWEAQFCGAPQGTPKDQQCAPLWKDKKTGEFK